MIFNESGPINIKTYDEMSEEYFSLLNNKEIR